MQVPSHVEYERATSVEHALLLLSRPETRIVAGGHSLIPMMKLRLAQPEVLVDINGLTELAFIRRDGDQLRIGALARHADLLESAVAGELFPIFHDAERVVADPIVRLWGTVGGSLCQADPSEDLSAVFAAARATAVIRGRDGDRTVPVREFHLGPYETVIGPGEMLAEVRVPVLPGTGSAYEKVARRVGDWSVAAAGAVLRLDGKPDGKPGGKPGGKLSGKPDGKPGGKPGRPVIVSAGLGLTAVGAAHFVAAEAEEFLRGRVADEESFAAAAALAAEHCRPVADQRGPEDYKRHLVAELTTRALRRALGRAAACVTLEA
jgi:carbon-monoxide dehydrogenase medium subunit